MFESETWDEGPKYNNGEERCKMLFEFENETIKVITRVCSFIYSGFGIYFDSDYNKISQ